MLRDALNTDYGYELQSYLPSLYLELHAPELTITADQCLTRSPSPSYAASCIDRSLNPKMTHLFSKSEVIYSKLMLEGSG